MKFKIVITLLILMLFCVSCAPFDQAILEKEEPISKPQIEVTNDIIDFQNRYILKENDYEYTQLEIAGFNVFYPKNNKAFKEINFCIDDSTEYIGQKTLLKGALKQEDYDKCVDWLSCLYDLGKYNGLQQMKKNVETRYDYLNDCAKDKMKSILESFVEDHYDAEFSYSLNSTDTQKTKFYSTKYITEYRLNEKILTGITFQVLIGFGGRAKENSIPEYYIKNDVYGSMQAVQKTDGVNKYSGGVELYLEVILDEQKQICGWKEGFLKNSETNFKRWCIFTENSIENYDGPAYYEQLPFDFIEYESGTREHISEINFSSRNIIDAIISMEDSEYYSNLSEQINLMTLDAKKFGIKVAVAPSSVKMFNQNNEIINLYKSEKYGVVYSYKTTAYIKTKNEGFNKKYGLNYDGYNACFEVYFVWDNTKKNVSPVAFKISSLPTYNIESVMEEYWNGTGNIG